MGSEKELMLFHCEEKPAPKRMSVRRNLLVPAMRKRSVITGLVTVAWLATGFAGLDTGWGQERSERPRLILVLSIDQMRYDYLTRFKDLYRGGLRRMLEQGAVFDNAKYRHAITETGPGHAVLLSGRHPSHSGIVANDWYDSFLDREVSVVNDPAHSAVGGEGKGASPAHFIGSTLGDVLKQNSPESRVVAVSFKDRSAVLMAGPRGDAAYWYTPSGGRFITSTYYMKRLPGWLVRWNGRRLADRYAGREWTRRIVDRNIYEEYAGEDRVSGEADRIHNTFPHVISGSPPENAFYDNLRFTPFADELTLSAGLAAIEGHALGTDAATDILAIGFSATDYVGHLYGPDSQEVLDQLLRLDQMLEELFEGIDRRIGLAHTLVVLSADHGVQPLVENMEAKGIDARRVHPSILEAAVRQALESHFPDGGALMSHFDTHVYLNDGLIRERGLQHSKVEGVVADAIRGTQVAEAVYTRSEIIGDAAIDSPYIEMFRNAFFEPRSPDVMVLPKKYYYIGPYLGGTDHGTAYDDDRHIPIVFMGPGINAAVYSDPCGPEDIAPTLARLLELELAHESDSRILSELIQ